MEFCLSLVSNINIKKWKRPGGVGFGRLGLPD